MEEWRQERDREETNSLDIKMEIIHNKLNRSQIQHEKMLMRVASEAKVRNDFVMSKIAHYKQVQEEREKNTILMHKN